MYSGCFDVRGQFQNFGFSGLSMWRSAASSISACGESQTGHILTINQGATRGKYAPVCESASDVSSNHDFVSLGSVDCRAQSAAAETLSPPEIYPQPLYPDCTSRTLVHSTVRWRSTPAYTSRSPFRDSS